MAKRVVKAVLYGGIEGKLSSLGVLFFALALLNLLGTGVIIAFILSRPTIPQDLQIVFWLVVIGIGGFVNMYALSVAFPKCRVNADQ